jgi:RND family efflux transporter MFP subunit
MCPLRAGSRLSVPRGGERIVYRNLIVVSVSAVAVFLQTQARNAIAAPPKDEGRDVLVLHHCDVEYEQSTVVSGHSGTGTGLPLQDCLVRLGDRVKAGQVIGRLVDRELRVQLALRRAEAESDIEVRLAESRRKELAQKMRRIEKLRNNPKGGYVSDEEHELVRIQLETAQLAIEEARYKRGIARIQWQEAEAQIKNREIVAPHDGIIVDVFKKIGESVIAGQPVFQIVEPDRLRVTAYSNLSDYRRVRPGQRIEIGLETDSLDPDVLGRVFEGKVLFVDKRVDPKSQTCRIVAAVENKDLTLVAGLEARMTIYASKTTKVTSSRPIPLAQPFANREDLLSSRAARTP